MTLPSALRLLAERGKIKSPWRPGMRFSRPNQTWPQAPVVVRVGESIGPLADYTGWDPDLTDPATLGCLLALVREASGDDGICMVHDGGKWGVADGGYRDPTAWHWSPTEGAALSAALIALAEQLP